MNPPAQLPEAWRRDLLLVEEHREHHAGMRVHGDSRGILVELPGGAWLGLGEPDAVAALVRELAGRPGFAWPAAATLPRGAWPLLADLPGVSARRPDAPSYSAWEWHLLEGEPARPPRRDEVIELDPARVATDRRDLSRLQARVLPDSYLGLDAPGARWFGWRDDGGTLRGLGGARGWDRYAHLGSIGTDPAWRGRGIGAAVTAAMCGAGTARTGHVSLSVYSSNQRALALYESLGFVAVHRFVTRRQGSSR